MNFDLEFNAPKFCDFTNLEELENDDAESYFDMDHEAGMQLRSASTGQISQEGTAHNSAKENATKGTHQVHKNVMMGDLTLLRPGERPTGLRDVTNSPGGGGRGRAPLKRANAVGARGAPRAKQSRSESAPRPAPLESEPESAELSMCQKPQEPVVQPRPPSPAVSRIPTPSRRGRSVGTPVRCSPRLATRGSGTPAATARGSGTPAATTRGSGTPAASARGSGTPAQAPTQRGRRRSVSAAGGAPPLPPRRPTPAGRRRTPAPSPVPSARRNTPSGADSGAMAKQPSRRTPAGCTQPGSGRGSGSTGHRAGSRGSGRRRSLSQNDAARALRSSRQLLPQICIAETPNVLRRGLELRSAARAAAERAVENEQEERLNQLRKQMANYKKKAALAKKEPMRPRLAPVRPTVPQPFHLHDRGGATARTADEFKSVAQMVEGFHRKTPPRFHSRPAGVGPDSGSDCSLPRTTVGRTPPLATRGRTRSHQSRPPSREQLEQAELEEAKQYQIRARPVNRRVLESTVGVPARQRRPSTRAEPFNLTQPQPKPQETEAEPVPEFHARPAPRQILEGTTGLPERQPPLATRPQSPALQLKQRMADRKKLVAETHVPQALPALRANPIPDMGVPFLPRVEHRTTVARPFSFENRDKQRQAEKERKIQQVLEEESRQREFRATLLPPDTPHGVPERRAQPATQPQPFQLPGEQISAAAAARRQMKLEEEAEQQRQAVLFQAQPCRVTRQQAFHPRPAERAPLMPQSPHLHTNQRSHDRLGFEGEQKRREAELQAQRAEAERRREEEEQAEVIRMRREAVHRAQPVRHYRPVHVQPSAVPLTEAQSPQWAATASRASDDTQ